MKNLTLSFVSSHSALEKWENSFYFPICSHIGHHRSQAGPLHLPVRCPLSLRPWNRVSSDHRDLRALAGSRLRTLHDHVHQEHVPDRIRPAGPRGRHVREHRRHNKLVQIEGWQIELETRERESERAERKGSKAKEGRESKSFWKRNACSSISRTKSMVNPSRAKRFSFVYPSNSVLDAATTRRNSENIYLIFKIF